MDQRAHKTAIDAAEFDITVGWSTGVGIVLLRLLVLLGALFAKSPVDWVLLAQVIIQTLAAAVFTYGLYKRRNWGAVGLLAVWGLGFFYSWYALQRVLPPLGILGILVWYGLYRGFRGVRALSKQPRIPAPAV